MKRILTILTGILVSLALVAKDKVEVDFFVRTFCDRNEIHSGDSTLVSYVLYATAPFAKVDCKTEMKVKNARIRALNINRRSAQGRTVENGTVYYTMVWEQYVVASDKVGSIRIPSLQFEAEFQFRRRPRTPFEDFFGSSEPPLTVQKKTRNEETEISVKEKPLRSSRELLREGGI